MKRIVRLKSIETHLPIHTTLPTQFARFIDVVQRADTSTHGWFHVAWRSPQDFELRASARATLVPFLKLGDGGVAALWFETPSAPAVAWFDSEGSRALVAASFADFLGGMARHQSGVPDIDDAAEHFAFPGLRAPKRKSLTAVQKRFQAWCEAQSSLERPTVGDDTEQLRKKLHALARQMIRDGRSRVYSLRDYWSVRFELQRTGKSFTARYQDFGEWYPVPKKYALVPLVEALVRHCRNPQLKRAGLTISTTGLVSVDRDRQLLLLPVES